VSALAHVFEQAGLATVGISIVRGQAEKSRPPRMLHCDFPLGRPLGKPGDAEFQHRVLAAAFDLLPRTNVPVLVDFPETITDEADAPLACTLPPRTDPSLAPALDEFLGLRAAWNRRVAATGGQTGVVRFGGPDHLVAPIRSLVAVADGAEWEQTGLTVADFGRASADIRAYYEEVALELVGHTPAARQSESWLYRSTEMGLLLRRAAAKLKAAQAPRDTWFRLVPTAQPPAPA
jgi:hypothetical protein